MADVFATLARELSTAERKMLLAKILAASESQDSTDGELFLPESEPPVDAEQEYASLSFLSRLIIAIERFFTRKPLEELMESLLRARVRRQIEAAAPGLVDFQNQQFTHRMRDELKTLAATLQSLRSALDAVPHRRDFIAFLAGLELAPLNDQIALETDPQNVFSEPILTEERDIRTEMARRLDKILGQIPLAKKQGVYRDVRRLQTLKALADVRVDDMVKSFPATGGGVDVKDLTGGLSRICDCLSGAFERPSSAAWNALFLFKNGEALRSPDFDIEKGSAAFLARVSICLRTLQEFARRVPLVQVVRYCLQELSYSPKEPGGGEEWFAALQAFWEERMEESLRIFSLKRRKDVCIAEAVDLCGLTRLPMLENYRPDTLVSEFPAAHYVSLAVIRAFYESVLLPKIDRYLKIVNFSGDFYKSENRAVFSDSCDKLDAAYAKLLLLDKRLARDGELGKRLIEMRDEKEPDAEERFAAAAQEIDQEALRIVESAYTAMSQLSRVVFGILYGEPGSPYDSVNNLSGLGGRENKAILLGLENAVRYFDKGAGILARIKDIETA